MKLLRKKISIVNISLNIGSAEKSFTNYFKSIVDFQFTAPKPTLYAMGTSNQKTYFITKRTQASNVYDRTNSWSDHYSIFINSFSTELDYKKMSLVSIFSWILTSDVVEKCWFTSVHCLGLTDVTFFLSKNLNDYSYTSKMLQNFR